MVEHGRNEHDQHTPESPPTLERHCDVAVVGGSAAGLAAALQLVRQRRSVIVIDDDTPRNAPAAHMHGYLGWDGAPPADLIDRGRAEVRSYGGEVLRGRARQIERLSDDTFHVEVGGGHRVVARRVLAATGLVDVLPDIEGLADHWGHDVIHCPFCHGYEVRDRRIVQIITHPLGFHPSTVFRHLTEHLTIVVHNVEAANDERIDELVSGGAEVVRSAVQRVVADRRGRVTSVELGDGQQIPADAVVVTPTFRPRAEVVGATGLTTTPHESGAGEVVTVDAAGQTAVPGLYAAGNLVDPTLQVLQAAAQGGRVGAMIAFDLAEDDLRTPVRVSGEQADWDHRYGGDEHMWSGNPNGTLVAEVADLAPGRVLDIGAGEGGDAVWLAEEGWTVTANDISERALARVSAAADQRGLAIESLHRDANALDAFAGREFDLVSMQYGSIHRTPEQRGLSNLLGAVAPGGTLLVVGHDLTPWSRPIDVDEQTRMFDPGGFVGINEIAAALADRPGWELECHETRPRPPGAASAHHHVDDVVLRARRSDD
ncbi:MAG: bifunctional NAD(P)/FAD-dependent oxidoreductase/class I SAM-dependent methyltransferase [Actinomycetota bacterium]